MTKMAEFFSIIPLVIYFKGKYLAHNPYAQTFCNTVKPKKPNPKPSPNHNLNPNPDLELKYSIGWHKSVNH